MTIDEKLDTIIKILNRKPVCFGFHLNERTNLCNVCAYHNVCIKLSVYKQKLENLKYDRWGNQRKNNEEDKQELKTQIEELEKFKLIGEK